MGICGGCNAKPLLSVGASQMAANVQAGRAYAFCDRRGTRIYPFVFQFGGRRAFSVNNAIAFGPDERIQGKTIKAIEIISTVALQSSGGIDNPGGVAYGYLTLVENCGPRQIVITQIPLSLLDRSQNGGKLFFCNFKNADFKSCYLTFTSGSLTSSNGLFFNFHVDENIK